MQRQSNSPIQSAFVLFKNLQYLAPNHRKYIQGMISDRILKGKARVYAIVDAETCEQKKIDIHEFTKVLLNNGIQIIQYRDKINPLDKIRNNFDKILSFSSKYDSVCIINDYLDVALEFNSAVHLGQEDGDSPEPLVSMSFEDSSPGESVEASLDSRINYGRSTHSLQEIGASMKSEPAPSYIAYGPVFSSTTKPALAQANESLSEIVECYPGDIVFIGGITGENLQQLPEGERFFYAIISGFFSDDPGYKFEKKIRRIFDAIK